MYRCNKKCCTRTFIPLEVAYARTIHKFQGLTAGPVDEGKIPNMYQCIICDPDEKKYEGTSLGLFYTALSRATTLGDEDGLNSAIYFTGGDFKEQRFNRLTKLKGSLQDFKNVIKRQQWVDYMKKRETQTLKRTKVTLLRKDKIIQDIQKLQFHYDFLYNRQQEYIDTFYKPHHF